jgi:hypothetical protein
MVLVTTNLSEIKKQTDVFLRKHPMDSRYALPDAVLSDFLTEICKSAAKGRVDDIEDCINTVYHYGFMMGCKSSKGTSMAANSAKPSRAKLDELAAVLAAYETK